MTKYYTEDKKMYFEVQKVEKGYEVHAFYLNNGTYLYERNIPEDITFKEKREANVVAQSLSWVFDWGVTETKDKVKEELIEKIKKSIK